ncbi:hypothetical protein NQZ68_022727 [Dissostichus eleginoides]|nr:hypothetical protein NQZ68_022727 [Dissostichus eleginoides]
MCQRIQTSDTEPLALHVRVFFSSLPLSCRCALLGMQKGDRSAAKVTLMESEGAFCLSALPSHAVHPPLFPWSHGHDLGCAGQMSSLMITLKTLEVMDEHGSSMKQLSVESEALWEIPDDEHEWTYHSVSLHPS